MGEYPRATARHRKGETETRPLLSLGYFEEAIERSLQEIEAKARALRYEKFLGGVSAEFGRAQVHKSRRGTVAFVYRNWLEHPCAQNRHSGLVAVLL